MIDEDTKREDSPEISSFSRAKDFSYSSFVKVKTSFETKSNSSLTNVESNKGESYAIKTLSTWIGLLFIFSAGSFEK